MKIKRILSFFLSAVICIFAMSTVSAAELRIKDIEKIISLRERMEENIKITDVRNELSSVSSRYTKAQLEEIIGIVNDAASETMAEEKYYIDLAEEFTAEQIGIIYKTASGGDNAVEDVSDGWTDTGKTNEKTSPNRIAIIVIVGICLLVALLLILIRKSYGKKDNSSDENNGGTKTSKENAGASENYRNTGNDIRTPNKKTKNDTPKPTKKTIVDDD